MAIESPGDRVEFLDVYLAGEAFQSAAVFLRRLWLRERSCSERSQPERPSRDWFRHEYQFIPGSGQKNNTGKNA